LCLAKYFRTNLQGGFLNTAGDCSIEANDDILVPNLDLLARELVFESTNQDGCSPLYLWVAALDCPPQCGIGPLLKVVQFLPCGLPDFETGIPQTGDSLLNPLLDPLWVTEAHFDTANIVDRYLLRTLTGCNLDFLGKQPHVNPAAVGQLDLVYA